MRQNTLAISKFQMIPSSVYKLIFWKKVSRISPTDLGLFFQGPGPEKEGLFLPENIVLTSLKFMNVPIGA